MSSTIELVYFPFGGRAFAIRLAFAVGKVDFKDTRLQWGEFGKAKAAGEFPMNQLPVLILDGKRYAQSMSILRYAGKRGGLYPSDPLEQLHVDGLIDFFSELHTLVTKSVAKAQP